ncbi:MULTISPECIES: GNAT family N-acetyltransferase [Streptomyces]|uniref:GNAT family N-acetyltransferase n=1 Tax=Streptomyces TaxID=1883 RepID=UPI0004CC5F24|nr:MULTISPECIES: GNAT family N-acetyltransferase [Streptomyces]
MPAEHEEVQVRPGAEGDLTVLTDPYDHSVRETAITFDTAPFTPQEHRPRLLSHPVDGPYRLMVATGAGARGIPGYAASGPFRPEPAYATSVGTTVHVAPRRGIGTLLHGALFQALAGEDVHRARAGVARPNDASGRPHERFGFRHVGTCREAGRTFGRRRDVARYEKEL